MYELHWSDPPTVEFQLPHGKWIELLRSCGFEIEELHELSAPPEGKSKYVWADTNWAQSWPTEETWVVKKGADSLVSIAAPNGTSVSLDQSTE